MDGQLFDVKNDGINAVQYYNNGYLSFGRFGCGFFVHGQTRSSAAKLYASRKDCAQYGLSRGQLNGTDHVCVVPIIEIEVFQIQQ